MCVTEYYPIRRMVIQLLDEMNPRSMVNSSLRAGFGAIQNLILEFINIGEAICSTRR